MNKPLASPIKDKPLRLPAQSLMEERQRIWDDKLEPWLLAAVFSRRPSSSPPVPHSQPAE